MRRALGGHTTPTPAYNPKHDAKIARRAVQAPPTMYDRITAVEKMFSNLPSTPPTITKYNQQKKTTHGERR
jgi:hypothetical protein